MATPNYRQTHSWKETIEFGRIVARLTDDLPKTEEPGLSAQLKAAMTDLATAVGLDLAEDGSGRTAGLIRMHALLDEVEAIYPGLDTGAVNTAFEHLETRLTHGQFGEAIASPAASHPSPDDEAEESPSSPSPHLESHGDHESDTEPTPTTVPLAPHHDELESQLSMPQPYPVSPPPEVQSVPIGHAAETPQLDHPNPPNQPVSGQGSSPDV